MTTNFANAGGGNGGDGGAGASGENAVEAMEVFTGSNVFGGDILVLFIPSGAASGGLGGNGGKGGTGGGYNFIVAPSGRDGSNGTGRSAGQFIEVSWE